MPDFDFGLALDFIDPADGVSRQLRFERNWAPPGDPRIFDGTGQLVAVVADAGRHDNSHTIAVSRPGVHLDDVHNALRGWETWAAITGTEIDLAAIRGRITNAGLGYRP
ncbi:hypothetical protein [Mycobacterium paragordonae]|jgi:hypothetical protein|uniref:hypothetical protein n=1 Tax=Mycobacterium paragordonae TaxID=1389713 RepID=UPI00105E79C4|nr:hypothetical protein [Mycobacterium paragordonae]TDK96789.1 hypothetical protein EUA05_32140 [Mycobacterium paragordonae]